MDSDALTFGKLRASWAQVGNATSAYQLASTWTSSTAINGLNQFYYDSVIANADLKPERKTSIELGGEFRFLKTA